LPTKAIVSVDHAVFVKLASFASIAQVIQSVFTFLITMQYATVKRELRTDGHLLGKVSLLRETRTEELRTN